MARLRFSPTPADFVIGLGASAEILDANEQTLTDGGDPPQPDPKFGRSALVPLESSVFQVYLDEDLNDHTTDLLDAGGDPIEAVTSSDEFETLGRLVTFQGPDDHFGPLFLSADGVTAYRVEPDSAFMWQLVNNVVNLIASGLTTNNLTDINVANRADGRTLVWDNTLGTHVYEDVDTAGAIAALSAGVLHIVEEHPTNGYPAELPAGPRLVIGPSQPSFDFKVWLQIVVGGS